MRAKNKKRASSVKYGAMLVGLILVLFVGMYSGFEFATFKVGDNFSLDIDWYEIESNTVKVFERGEQTSYGSLTFDENFNNQLVNFDINGIASYTSNMQRSSVGMPCANIAASFSNFKYVATVGGLDTVYSVTKDGIVTPHSTIESGGYIYDTYKIRFTIAVQSYSFVTSYDSSISYTPEVGDTFDTNFLSSTAPQDIVFRFLIKTIKGEDALDSSTFTVVDTRLVEVDELAKQYIVRETDVGYETIMYDTFIGESIINDKPKMTSVDAMVIGNNITSFKGNDNVELGVSFMIAPGAAFIDGEWKARDLYAEFDIELELSMVYNTYENAKFRFLDSFIDILPKQIGYGYIQENFWYFVIVIIVFVTVPLGLIFFGTRRYTRKFGSMKLEDVM